MVRRFVGAVAAALVVTWALGSPASAASTLDQSQEEVDGGFDLSAVADVRLAQIFTAGRTGRLDRVDVHVGADGPAPTTVAIHAVDGGEPVGGPLASAAVELAEVEAWLPVDLGFGAVVQAGTRYAIVVTADVGSGATILVSLADGDAYPHGEGLLDVGGGWSGSDVDWLFRTYVGPIGTELRRGVSIPGFGEWIAKGCRSSSPWWWCHLVED